MKIRNGERLATLPVLNPASCEATSDDFVICAQYRSDAEGLLAEIKARLAKFGLEVAAEKTRIIEFGRFAKANAEKRGGKPEAFDFLGFTHYCSKTLKGKFT